MNDLVKPPALRVYNWTSDEFLLLDWYNNLVTSGDHYLMFDRDMRYVSNFLAFFKPPQTLAYAVDKGGIWFAYWLSPYMSGATVGLWVREEKRAAKTTFELLIECFNESFKTVTVLVTITKQESVGAYFTKLGGVYGMTIPALCNGEDVSIFTMTRGQWEARNHVVSIRRRQ